jgi:transposase
MAEKKESVEATVRTIRRVTRKKYSAEEKVRIVLEGLRGETSIACPGQKPHPSGNCLGLDL